MEHQENELFVELTPEELEELKGGLAIAQLPGYGECFPLGIPYPEVGQFAKSVVTNSIPGGIVPVIQKGFKVV